MSLCHLSKAEETWFSRKDASDQERSGLDKSPPSPEGGALSQRPRDSSACWLNRKTMPNPQWATVASVIPGVILPLISLGKINLLFLGKCDATERAASCGSA